ncbi:MAG TPA: glycosyltransferase [Acidimicrobiales bacterium]|nr:glycosyltransferase [Acidimicrobiales bacterium]
MSRNVLIVSASMGAGHDGVAKELANRLEARGWNARRTDFLDALPFRIGPLIRWIYVMQLKVAPWSYEATYRLWFMLPFLCPPIVSLDSFLARRRIGRWVTEQDASVVVSTYPLASLVLGRMRQRGQLTVPAITFITDFGVHPLWVQSGVDLHLCVHPDSAAAAADRTGRPAAAPGPAVSDRFHATRGLRAPTRARFGLGPHDKVVLVVAGSWGVGDVEETFNVLAGSGRYVPVAVCGNNERLRRRLEATGQGVVLGWTDEMPALMAAADAIVQNAGGLTCMEAFAVGLPVVTFRPIPGHGRQNAEDMDRAGVSLSAADGDDLLDVLDRVTGLEGRRMAATARSLFVADAADDVERMAGIDVAPVPAMARAARPRPRRARLAGAAVGVAMAYTALTTGVSAATARGFGVQTTRRNSQLVYVAVRVTSRQLDDRKLPAELASLRATAVLDGLSARQDGDGVRNLLAAGVEVANGGWGGRDRVAVYRTSDDVVRSSRAIARITGAPVRTYVPSRRVDGFDLTTARLAHERIVLTEDVDPDGGHLLLRPGHIYEIDGRDLSGVDLDTELHRLAAALEAEHLEPAGLRSLT